MIKLGRFWISFLVVSVFILSSLCAQAAEKTGFINIQDIIRSTDVGKKAEEDFRKEVDKKKAYIKEKEDEVKILKESLEKQGPMLLEKARKEKEAVFQEKLNNYYRLVKDANEEMQMKEKEVFDKLLPDIMKIVNNIGEKENFTLILDRAMIPVAYYDTRNDLTKRVIEEVNKTLKPKK
jgi:outer membrane protein